jgi:hypothetical protein
MSKVESREYKVMMNHQAFAKRKAALKQLWRDLKLVGKRCRIKTDGQFDTADKRTIQFIDTSDFTFRNSLLIFRRRQDANNGEAEFTLKCRTEDRYIAEGADLQPAEGLKGKRKLEEDIAAPFRSRFSRSTTVKAGDIERPATISAAQQLFPVLGKLRANGLPCEGETPVVVVGQFTAFERVAKGPVLELGAGVVATVAAILWSNSWKERTIAAELSFRYGNDDEEYPPEAAEAAFRLFEAVQTLDWCLPEGATKTQFAYGEN